MEKIPEHSFEKAPVVTETLTPQVLRSMIINEDHEIDPRFLPKEAGGVFHYFEPGNLRTEDYFSIVKEQDLITGIAELQESPFTEKLFWMKSISVDPEFQGKGYATKLAEEIIKFTKNKGYQLEMSSYSSKDAQDKLEKIFKRFAEQYGVTLVLPQQRFK